LRGKGPPRSPPHPRPVNPRIPRSLCTHRVFTNATKPQGNGRKKAQKSSGRPAGIARAPIGAARVQSPSDSLRLFAAKIIWRSICDPRHPAIRVQSLELFVNTRCSAPHFRAPLAPRFSRSACAHVGQLARERHLTNSSTASARLKNSSIHSPP